MRHPHAHGSGHADVGSPCEQGQGNDWRAALSWDSLRPVFDALAEGVYVVDSERRIVYWNAAAEQITGHTAVSVARRFCSDNLLEHVGPDDARLCHGNCPLHATLADGCGRDARVYLQHKLGYRLPVAVQVVPLRNVSGTVVAAAEIFHRVGVVDHRQELAKANRLAFEDSVTALPNRRFAEHELASRLEILRTRGEPVAVLMVDLDHFKAVNDRYGHAAGDAALRVVSRSLSAGVRIPDVVTRWGGEEFLVLLGGLDDPGVQAVAERLKVLVRRTRVDAGVAHFYVTASIGATQATEHDNPESVVERADAAMYESKRAGRDRVSYRPPPVSKPKAALPNPAPPGPPEGMSV